MPAWVACAAVLLAAACGGGDYSTTTVTGGGLDGATGGGIVSLEQPNGPNTTEIVVDRGPASAFALGVTNLPYVTLTVCAPGASDRCATLDHVFLDTGSIGLRVLKSRVAGLGLPTVDVPADAASGTPAGRAFECFPFVLGAVWGPLARADVRIGGEFAGDLPIQLIDDDQPSALPPTADCAQAADGALMNSVTRLQAQGILGIGMLGYDCGLACVLGDYAGGHVLYYSCGSAAGSCVPAAVPVALQVQNPVVHFDTDNNGTIVVLPAAPELGAEEVRGRLVFGIGTRDNNQIAPSAQVIAVDPDPSSASYLYVDTTVSGRVYPWSYVDSGSNALFFDDAGLPLSCAISSGSAGWYCPNPAVHRTATLANRQGQSAQVPFSVASADVLFSSPNVAFGNLAGSVGQGGNVFVWGLPFFYGRPVYTSIWGQALSADGPWYAF